MRALKLGHDTAGAAALEFALIAPVLVLLSIGVADYGNAVVMATKLNLAARSAAQYAVRYPVDFVGIQAVGNAASNLAGSPVGTPILYCTCGASKPIPSGTDESSCPTQLATISPPACSTGYTHVYIYIPATASFTPMSTGRLVTLSSGAILEVP